MSKPCANVKAGVRLYALDIPLVIPITIVFGVLEFSKAKMLVLDPELNPLT